MSKSSFKGGVHPLHDMHGGKDATRNQAIKAFVPETVCIPMDMHIGAPSNPIVKKGDRVLMGQVIGEAVGGIGIPVHASVSGEVTEVAVKQLLGKKPSQCVTIRSNGQDEWIALSPLGDVEAVDAAVIIPAIRAAGICGLGGACFPTHAKLSPPKDKVIDAILVNGAECETFLNADNRLMIEQPERVVNGLRAAMRAMNVAVGIIGIEDNKPEAIAAVTKAAEGREGVRVQPLKTKYPQGGEKQLIQVLLGREVPSGKLPMDAGAVVVNAGTAAAIADAVLEGKPLVSRITTITGRVKEPSNLLVRIGTSFADAIDFCGGYSETPGKVFAGGSMTGISAPTDTVSITKANNGVVVLNEKEADIPAQTNCIRCSRCIQACPINLNPYQMHITYALGKIEELEKQDVLDCILCGACSYVCPAHRYLTPAFKDAKDIIAMRRTTR